MKLNFGLLTKLTEVYRDSFGFTKLTSLYFVKLNRIQSQSLPLPSASTSGCEVTKLGI